MRIRDFTCAALCASLLLLCAWADAQDAGATNVVGWRQNWTGRFPDSAPPTTWGRIPKGVVRDLWSSSEKPKDASAPQKAAPAPDVPAEQATAFRGGLIPIPQGSAGVRPVEDGFIQDWLVAGPFAVGDTQKEFDAEQIPDVAALEPDAGDKAGASQWTPLFLHKNITGDINMPWVNWFDWMDLDLVFKTKENNQVGYALTYLYSPRAGKAVIVIEHSDGAKAWVNGKTVYTGPSAIQAHGCWSTISYLDAAFVREGAVPRFEVEFKPGWNRLLLKLTRGPKGGGLRVFLRVVEPPNVEYVETNIAWKTKLPDRGNATPIIVGDRIFLTCEPDDLLCIDKKTGKVLWKHSNNYFDSTPEAERNANPAFKETIAPLVEEFSRTDDYDRRLALRREIRDALVAVDKDKYAIKFEDHKVSHFRINGWATPTPVSDGKFVYGWFTHGTAACYDLSGNRQWIVRVDRLDRDPRAQYGPYSYPSSPVLMDGKLILWGNAGEGGAQAKGVIALDARTGRKVWRQTACNNATPALTPGKVAGKNVVFAHDVAMDPADGKVLWKPSGVPLFQDGVIYHCWGGGMMMQDLSAVKEEPWKPTTKDYQGFGKWHPTFFFASPVVEGGILYCIEFNGNCIAADIKTGTKYYEKQLDTRSYTYYNDPGVSASPATSGKHVFFFDNQGTGIVLEQGPEFKQVARNRIETQMVRPMPFNPNETFHASPVLDGKYLYLRGEQYLYCIGEK